MATTYRATITFSVWKQHTCVQCSGQYRYLLKRKMTGRGRTQSAASKAAEANVLRAIQTEVDQHPCPTCGLYQPDMVAVTRGRAHLWVFLGFLCACAGLAVAGFLTDWAWFVPCLGAAVATIALTAHVLVDARNPNRQQQANLNKAQRSVEAGDLHLTAAGDALAASTEASGAAWRPAGQALIYVLFGLGILMMPACEALRLGKGWPTNADWRPHVVGPGDQPYIYFPTKISSVKGYWTATGKAVVLNAAELGLPSELKLTSKETSWGATIDVKDEEKNSSSTLYAWVELPNNPKLAGKTLHLKMDLKVVYPKLQGDKFGNMTLDASHTADLVVAKEVRAGAAYQQWYWLGLLGGLVVTVCSGGALVKRAGSVRSQALPTEIHVPGKESAEDTPLSHPGSNRNQ